VQRVKFRFLELLIFLAGVLVMLLFIDEPKHLRIVRQPEEGGTREMLGRINKTDLQISEDLQGQLEGSEEAEIKAAFMLVSEGEQGRLKSTVASFPATIRELLIYYREGATPSEQRWIRGALQEGLRIARKHDRESVGSFMLASEGA
jgi:hypothetical protein